MSRDPNRIVRSDDLPDDVLPDAGETGVGDAEVGLEVSETFAVPVVEEQEETFLIAEPGDAPGEE